MKEQHSPAQPIEDRLSDYHESPFITFSSDICVAGDPSQQHEFSAALSFLDLLAEHFLESGHFWALHPAQILDRLEYLNARHNYEVELEHKSGECSAQYRTITAQHLRALSQRKLSAMKETGWEDTWSYRIASFLHVVLERTVAELEEHDSKVLVAQAVLGFRDSEDDVPF